MDFIQIRDTVFEFAKENFKTNGKIIELQKKETSWIAKIEVIEESDYMRKIAKTDVIGLYEVEIDFEGQIVGYRRYQMRERGTLNQDV
jgi:hypothetical protein